MLSVLPNLLFLSFFIPMILRITLSFMLAYSAWHGASERSTTRTIVAFVETILAASLFVGVGTQVAAIATVVLLGTSLVRPHLRVWPRSTVVLMLVISFTLIFSGAGAIAFDLPL